MLGTRFEIVVGSVLTGAALLLCAWYLEYRLPPSDEGAILTQAARILDGDVYYRDLDAYVLPGASYLLALALAVFGEHLSVARWVAGGVFAAIVLGVWACARQVIGPRRAVWVGVAMLSFKFLAWPGLTAYLYWDVAFALACVSVALFVASERELSLWPLFLAGACAGLALLCKQTVGLGLAGACVAVLVLADVLLGAHPASPRRRAAALAAYAGGAALALLPALAYFGAQGVLGRMLYSGFVRPLTDYLPTSGVSYLVPLRWWELGRLQPMQEYAYAPEPWWQLVAGRLLPAGEVGMPVYWLLGEVFSRALYSAVPLAFAWAAWLWLRALRRDPPAAERRLLVFAALAFAVFLSAFPRADFSHVISVFPLVMVLLFAWAARLASRFGEPRRRRLRRAEPAVVVLGLLVTLLLAARLHASFDHRLHLERADLRVSEEYAYAESVVRYVADEVEPDESILVMVHEAYYYFLTDRYFDWPFVQLYPGMTGSDDGVALAERLERAPPRLVLRGPARTPGLPRLRAYAPAAVLWVDRSFVLDMTPFERYPTRMPVSFTQVLRPRRAGDR